jgi:hypothetical protein
MDRQSLQKLRLDRRLAERTGWIPREELDRELGALPDVSDKLTTLGEAEEESKAAAAAAPAPTPAPASQPEPSAVGLASAEGARSEATRAEGSGESSAVGQPGDPETSF